MMYEIHFDTHDQPPFICNALLSLSKQPHFSHIGILDKMNNHQSDIDALHGQMTSQLNIDPEVLSGVRPL